MMPRPDDAPSPPVTRLYDQFDQELRSARLTPIAPAVQAAAVKLSLWSEAAGSVSIEQENGDLHAIAAQAATARGTPAKRSIQAAMNASRALTYITATQGPGANHERHAADPDYVQEIHHIALNKLLPPEKLGEWRINEAAVEAPNGQILLEGAAPEEIDDKMRTWSIKYDPSNDQHHPLHALAMGHADFEKIHPFADGNGRTGRLILQAMALERGLPVLPISKLLDQHRIAYFATLNKAQTANQTQEWLRFVAEAAIHSIRHQARMLPALTDFIAHTRAATTQILGPAKSADLAIELASQPMFSSSTIASRLRIAEPRLNAALDVLYQQKVIGRSQIHTDLFAISPLAMAAKPYMVAASQQEHAPRHAR